MSEASSSPRWWAVLGLAAGCVSIWVFAGAWPGDPIVATLIQVVAAYGITLILVGTIISIFSAEPGEDPTPFDEWLERESEGDSWWDDADDGG